MDRTTTSGRKLANGLLILGWFLTLVNAGAVALSVLGPVRLYLLPKDILFSVEDGVAEARLICFVLVGLLLLALLQIWLLPKLAVRMVQDSRATRDAEFALRFAQRSSYVAILFCIAGLVLVTRTFRTWADILRMQA